MRKILISLALLLALLIPTSQSPAQAFTRQLCKHTTWAAPVDIRQMTSFTVNSGVIGPNLFIYQGAELLLYLDVNGQPVSLYGYAVVWVNSLSTASGYFYSGGVPYIPWAPFGQNYLALVPQYEIDQNLYLCGPNPPAPFFH